MSIFKFKKTWKSDYIPYKALLEEISRVTGYDIKIVETILEIAPKAIMEILDPEKEIKTPFGVFFMKFREFPQRDMFTSPTPKQEKKWYKTRPNKTVVLRLKPTLGKNKFDLYTPEWEDFARFEPEDSRMKLFTQKEAVAQFKKYAQEQGLKEDYIQMVELEKTLNSKNKKAKEKVKETTKNITESMVKTKPENKAPKKKIKKSGKDIFSTITSALDTISRPTNSYDVDSLLEELEDISDEE